MTYEEIENILKNKNYDETVIYGAIAHLKSDPKADILRLRINGVDIIRSHGDSMDSVKKDHIHWNAEFIKIK